MAPTLNLDNGAHDAQFSSLGEVAPETPGETAFVDDIQVGNHLAVQGALQPYSFELFAPSVTQGSFLYTLLLSPEEISVSDPFVVEVTPGLDGGLIVEENGIIVRQIRIAGTLGFFKRAFPADVRLGDDALKSHARSFPWRGTYLPVPITGHRQFHFLQDRVFRIYGDLKRNPRTSFGTKLIFHNFWDEQHWRVIPQNFQEVRGGNRRIIQSYVIDMLAVAMADGGVKDKSPPEMPKPIMTVSAVSAAATNIVGTYKSTTTYVLKRTALEDIVDTLKRALRGINDFSSTVTNALQNNGIAEFVNDLQQAVQLAVEIVNQATNTVSTVTNMVARLASTATAIIRACDQIINVIHDTVSGIVSKFNQVVHSFRSAWEHLVASAKAALESDFTSNLDARVQLDRVNEVLRNRNTDQTESSVTTPSQLREGGTGFLGNEREVQRILRSALQDRPVPTFRSIERRTLSQADTLETLAAQRLGDPGLWPAIALLNNLRAPYLSAVGIPGTLSPGDIILIPSQAPRPGANQAPSIFPELTDEGATRVFGRDWAIKREQDGTYDWVVDGSGQEFRNVEGVDNLVQAIDWRINTPLGKWELEPTFGRADLIGTSSRIDSAASLEISTRRCLLADPRIQAINRCRARIVGDIAVVEVEATPLGFDRPVSGAVATAI